MRCPVRRPSDNTLRVLLFAGLAACAVGVGVGWRLWVVGLAVYIPGALVTVAAVGVLLFRSSNTPPLPPGDALLDRALTRRAKRDLRKFRGLPPRPHREDSHA